MYSIYVYLSVIYYVCCLPRTLCNARRLFICLSATLCKTSEWIFTKILPQTYLCTGKNWLHSGSHRPPDPGIFWSILQHSEIGHFSTIRLTSPERVIRFSRNFIVDVSLDKSSLNFGSYLGPDFQKILGKT